MMTAIPQACMEYTEVLTTMKLELGIALLIGIRIGWFLRDK